MLKAIITYLNLKLELLNYFDLTRCLVELKESETDNGTLKQPVEYISNGEFDVINFDEFNGVSYWRLRDEPSTERTETQKYRAGAKNNIETTIPLRLVFAVPRTKLTEDDAYSFDRIRQTMVKQFAIDDEVLKNQLGAISVRITQVGSNSKPKEVWEEETEGTGTFEPKYETVFGSIDVDVVVISDHECLPTECDDVESDILRAFDWCGNTAVTVGRLTQLQQTCISDYLCGSPDPVQIQVNGTNTETAASGTTYNQEIENTDGTAVGTAANPSVVGDSDISFNGNLYASIPAEKATDFSIHDEDDNDVGTLTPSDIEIANSTVTINGSSLGSTGSVLAEGSVDIPVNLDGSPAGSWDGDSWEVTSAPCADATVQLNGVNMTDIPSGSTENIEVRQETGATLVGSKQGQYWRIDDSPISINGSQVADVASEESLDISVLQGGSPVGSWSGSAWVVPATACPSIALGSYSDSGFTNPITETEISETVYLKAVASDITPSKYRFLYESSDSIPQLIYEGANDNASWVAIGASGAGRFFCHVTDNDDDWSGRSEDFTINNDPDVQDFLDETGITDNTIIFALNQLVNGFKSDGDWSDINAFYPFVGGTAATHKYNLKDPRDLDAAFRLDFFGGWTHGENGIKGNGTNTYADTHLVDSAVASASDESFGIYSRTDVDALQADMGADTPYAKSNIVSRYSGDFYARNQGTYVLGSATSDSLGLFISSRINSSEVDGYNNGTLHTISDAQLGLTNISYYIGAVHNTTGPQLYYSTREYGCAFHTVGLSVAAEARVRDRINTFMTALGRNV